MRAIPDTGERPARTLAEPIPGSTRGRVLQALRASGEPQTVQAVASEVGLHVNTARFHLDALVTRRLASRSTEDRNMPGRPRRLYEATADAPITDEGHLNHQLLALILSSALLRHAPHPEQAAYDGGEAWGRYLTRKAPDIDIDRPTAIKTLVRTLEGLGFAPRVDGGGHIELRHCAFREVAEQHRALACSAHLGLIRGVLAELGAPLEVRDLQAEVVPGLCIAALADRTTGEARPSQATVVPEVTDMSLSSDRSASVNAPQEWAECALNEEALAFAHDLIQARHFVIGTQWADDEPTQAQRQAFLKQHSWDRYALWHLGLTEGAAEHTVVRYDFAFGDFSRLHRSALVECIERAATYRDRSIEKAARDLLELLDHKAGVAST